MLVHISRSFDIIATMKTFGCVCRDNSEALKSGNVQAANRAEVSSSMAPPLMIFPVLIVAVSGFCVMASELMAGRLFAPYFGQSAHTWAALVGATLSGCALGNAFGGWLSGRFRPGTVCAVGLVLAAAWTALLPSAAGPVAGTLAVLGLPFAASLTLAALALFLPPVFFLGWVTPSAAAAAVRAGRSGADLGALYAGSMAGSFAGSLAGGLWLPFVFPALEIFLSLAVAMLVLAPLSVLALRTRGGTPSRAVQPEFQPTLSTGEGTGIPRRTLALMLFMAGAVCMGVEMAGARLVIPALGGSHVVWGTIFATFILWMGVGGLAGGLLADRFPGPGGVSAALSSGAAAVLSALFAAFFLGGAEIVQTLPVPARLFLQASLPFAPAALALGAVSTVLLRAAVAGGANAGRCYALSALGSVAGTFLTGYVLVGAVRSAALYGALALVLLLCARAAGAYRRKGAAVKHLGARACACAGGMAIPAALLCCLSGNFLTPPAAAVREAGPVVSDRESRYGRVVVAGLRGKPSARAMFLDRIPHTVSDMASPLSLASAYTRMLACSVGALSKGRTGFSLFMVGGGGYALPRYWRASGLGTGGVVVAEIDPAVQDAAVRFLDAAPAPWMRYIAEDGRRSLDGLLRDGSRFDLAVGDTVSDVAVPYHLATREFGEKIHTLLLEDGYYLMHVLDVEDRALFLPCMLATLGEVFPHIEALCYTGVRDIRQPYILVAGNAPIPCGAILERLSSEYPDSDGRFLTDAEKRAMLARPGVIAFTDGFAPVERSVWETMAWEAARNRAAGFGREAVRLLDAGKLAEAVPLARRALEGYPEHSDALSVIRQAIVAGAFPREEGLALLEAQATRRSSQKDARAIYALALKDAGDNGRAANVWGDLARSFPRDTGLMIEWLTALACSGRGAEAETWLKERGDAELGTARADTVRAMLRDLKERERAKSPENL